MEKITNEEISGLERGGAMGLPDRPSSVGYKPNDIKKALWVPIEALIKIINSKIEDYILESNNISSRINACVKSCDVENKNGIYYLKIVLDDDVVFYIELPFLTRDCADDFEDGGLLSWDSSSKKIVTVVGYAKAEDVSQALSEKEDKKNLKALAYKESLSKSDIGLGNVVNESKEEMFENATLTGTPTAPTANSSDNSTQIANTAFVKTVINNLVNGAPSTLDTLGEISAAMANNATVVEALQNAIGDKLGKNEASEVYAKKEEIIKKSNGITYDNANSGLIADNVQDAIDAVNVKVNDRVVKKAYSGKTISYVNINGNDSYVEVGSNYKANSIPYRNGSGLFEVGNATADNHVLNRKTADNRYALKGAGGLRSNYPEGSIAQLELYTIGDLREPDTFSAYVPFIWQNVIAGKNPNAGLTVDVMNSTFDLYNEEYGWWDITVKYIDGSTETGYILF